VGSQRGFVESLDRLLGRDEPHATFHDARVEALNYDPGRREAWITARLCVGDPTADSKAERERRRSGVLHLQGVSHWGHEHSGVNPADGFFLADEGPLDEAPTEIARQLCRKLKDGGLGWYFYFSDSNSYLYWIADAVQFRWSTSGDVAHA
jgi:hypothetical protein